MKGTKTMIIITGCGRSGTKYISKLCQSNGIDIGHEDYGTDGIVSWYLAPSLTPPSGVSILHQVRHPLKVISSMTTALDKSWNYISNFVHFGLDDSLLLKCMKYWHDWNMYVEDKANYRYRIEDIGVEFPKLLEISGFKAPKKINYKIPKNINTRKHVDYTKEDLEYEDKNLYSLIKDTAKRYGYKM